MISNTLATYGDTGTSRFDPSSKNVHLFSISYPGGISFNKACNPATRQLSLQYENQSSGASRRIAYSFEMDDFPRVFNQRWTEAIKLQIGDAVHTSPNASSLFQTKSERGNPVPGIATLAKLSMISCL